MELKEKLKKLEEFYEGFLLDETTSEESLVYYSGCVRTIRMIIKALEGDSSDIIYLIGGEENE